MGQGADLEHIPRISIVIGVQSAHKNIDAILSAFEHGPVHDIEVLLCYAANDPVSQSYAAKPYVRLIKCTDNALIPELWRDGIYQAHADVVAILTAHCIPLNDWLGIALKLNMKECAGYGGVIELGQNTNSVGAAIHQLRYAMFTPPQKACETFEIAADNAVYRRADILACEGLLAKGFWEPSFHGEFQKNGEKMALDPSLIVIHNNQYTVCEFIGQRRLHGHIFGLMRADDMSVIKNAAMFVFSPAAYFIFGFKVMMRTVKSETLRRYSFTALPWLALFLGGWVWGEASGYAASLLSKISDR